MGEHEAWNGNGESSTSMPSLSGLERLDEIARMSRLKQHWTDQVKQFSREDLEGELIDRGLPDAQLREMADASEEILRREVVAARLREAFPPFKKGRPAVWKSAIEVRGPLHIEHDGWAERAAGRRTVVLVAEWREANATRRVPRAPGWCWHEYRRRYHRGPPDGVAPPQRRARPEMAS